MKLWWPHNEAIYATLLAYHLTGDPKYEAWHGKVNDYAYSHFPDKEYGDWFKYLHKDGSLSSRIKGNTWAGPFHLSRMQIFCWKLLEEMKAKL
jgi:N-acylglucosamine 2-epimerase